MAAKHLRALGVAAGVSLVSLVPFSASAQEQPGYAANQFNPSERGSRWFVLDSLDFRGHGRLALGLVNDYSYRSLVDYKSDGRVNAAIVENQNIVHLGASVTLADRVRLGLSVPLQLYADGDAVTVNGVVHQPGQDVAAGDVRVSTDVRLFGRPTDAATMAAGVQLFMPAGSPQAYTGDGKPRVLPQLMFAGRASVFAYAARVGFMYRVRDEPFIDGQIGNQFVYAASAGVMVDDKLLVGPELFGATAANDRAFEARTTPLEILLGAHYDVGANLRIGAGFGPHLTRGYGAPVVRGLLSLEWIPDSAPAEEAPKPAPEVNDDRDGDGIKDSEDACAFASGPKSDDPAKNGCPDSDADGIPDVFDACSHVAGQASSDPAKNGCPGDADGDGVPDNEDACPSEKGARSLDARQNGCPSRDQDSDGILDVEDACPSTAGVKTTDPKTNGCPDPDRDHDGITNENDACPDAAGKSDPDPKKNGCPKAFLDGDSIKITDQVRFKNASADIVAGKDSEEVLQAVLAVLKAHSEIAHLRVEGHSDDRGAKAAKKALSASRAAAVVKWLSDHGIAKERLSAVGFGDEKPLEPNTTDDARSKNRRVEFHVEQSGSGR
ncbi:Outer membrane lipoprotein omp16 precursor [Labilithrix luteola]|uniref:Outer membrane lipoprotein omp16 n=1 Tax=Labilithrix luteola TaxID=1391654 RepID=A0A0K1PT00_9BACT|nr:OmpA family protein [Labilithrix luteola]AKU96501.1 Outer membrane lipoprotein omp16 precursor [Labilithrix luteola]